MTGDEILTELGWSDDMIRGLLQIQTRPRRNVAKTDVTDTTANECWPPPRRERHGSRKCGGIRRYVVPRYDWHLDRVVSAIRSTVEGPGKPAVADALAAAIAKQEARERVASRRRKQEETEAARRLKEEVVVSGLRVELRALRATDPGMSQLTAWNTSPLTLPTG
jgi:hypothetical protein